MCKVARFPWGHRAELPHAVAYHELKQVEYVAER